MDLVDITNFNLIYFILLSLSLAEFALQVTISDLSQWVLDKIGLNQPYKLNSLSKVSFWKKLFNGWFYVLSPLFLIIVLLFSIHKFFAHMLACPFCTGYHLGWLTFWLVLGMPVFQSLLFAPLVLVGVAILDKIHSH